MNRRTFLRQAVWAASSTTLSGRLLKARALQSNPLGDFLDRNFTIDLHTHPALFPVKDAVRSSNPRRYRGDDAFAERIGQMTKGKVWSGIFSLVTDAPILGMTPQGPGATRKYDPGEGWQEYKRQLNILEDLAARNGVRKATSTEEIRQAHQAGQAAAIFGCEGGDHLEGRVERVEDVYADGVRHIQLVHVATNELGDPNSANPTHGGLTARGKTVVQEMNRLGMVIDLAHASYQTTRDAARISKDPLMLTHALLQESGRSMVGLSLDHLKAIADTGGVVGVFCGAGGDVEGVARNVMRMVQAIGIDHVGFGTDMDGTGGRSALDDYRLIPELAARLKDQGLDDIGLAKMLGANAARVFDAVLK